MANQVQIYQSTGQLSQLIGQLGLRPAPHSCQSITFTVLLPLPRIHSAPQELSLCSDCPHTARGVAPSSAPPDKDHLFFHPEGGSDVGYLERPKSLKRFSQTEAREKERDKLGPGHTRNSISLNPEVVLPCAVERGGDWRLGLARPPWASGDLWPFFVVCSYCVACPLCFHAGFP
jgi:hypothetical protein